MSHFLPLCRLLCLSSSAWCVCNSLPACAIFDLPNPRMCCMLHGTGKPQLQEDSGNLKEMILRCFYDMYPTNSAQYKHRKVMLKLIKLYCIYNMFILNLMPATYFIKVELEACWPLSDIKGSTITVEVNHFPFLLGIHLQFRECIGIFLPESASHDFRGRTAVYYQGCLLWSPAAIKWANWGWASSCWNKQKCPRNGCLDWSICCSINCMYLSAFTDAQATHGH